ncbi:MAG: RpiB/LacA/LacB family sugar-phosphate isomerase [Myxococcales bacterium]|nr:RpiB/LacA/LacB family sugar-phosphate isomerase [Myxococcales bacterium]MCB9709467.1 RpiB/LacA/LacB family sugar-phosphate isomerase [Myxococcales bacterium]
MRIAICSDENYPLHAQIADDLTTRGHILAKYGSFSEKDGGPWALVAEQAARAVAQGACAEGIFFCWTGTGISIAANKIRGVRAALCNDAVTAAGARTWNHANVLCLSNRLLSGDVAKEIFDAWFSTPFEERGQEGVRALSEVEKRHCRL